MANKYSRRHYAEIADLLRQLRLDIGQFDSTLDYTGVLDCVVSRFSARFQADNPNFDPGRFKNATKNL